MNFKEISKLKGNLIQKQSKRGTREYDERCVCTYLIRRTCFILIKQL
jgi:hypothetical protein